LKNLSDPLEASFARTWRLLAIAKIRTQLGAIVALSILFTAWLGWLVIGKVSVYVSSEQASFVAERYPEGIQAAVSGVIVFCNLHLGQRVHDGEILAKLDARQYELQLMQATASLKANEDAIDAIKEEIAAQERAREGIAKLVYASARAGNAKVAVSRASQQFQEKESEVLRKLNEKDLASTLDALRAERENATTRAQTTATSAEAAQATSSERATLLDRDAQIAALTKLLTDAQSQVDVLKANIETINYQIELRNIRARANGVLADVTQCALGASITPDQEGGILVPDSDVLIAAYFKPQQVVGRVRPGQLATVRVNNFPWTQYGTVGGTVERVGSEAGKNGLVRIELRVSRENRSIPIMDGLTAVVEVEVEKISPFQLLLRTMGQQLAPTDPVAASGTSNAPPDRADR
jgi:multidrug resistance efflux pump